MWGIKAYAGEEGRRLYSFKPFATSVLVVGGNLHQAPEVLPPAKKRGTHCTLYRWLGGLKGRSGRARKISSPPGFNPLPIQPVASFYNHYDILTDFQDSFFKKPGYPKANITEATFRITLSTALHIHPLPRSLYTVENKSFMAVTNTGLNLDWRHSRSKLA
jgi:hypothetical protein